MNIGITRVAQFVSKATSALLTLSIVAVSFANVTFPSTAFADGSLVINTINGAPPTGFCIAGPISITGSGITGQQGGKWSVAIGWGDNSTTTISVGSPELTSGTLNGSGKAFGFAASHTPTGPSTGLTIILYHSQVSGQDGTVIFVSQCVAPPTQGVVILKKHVINNNSGTAVAGDFSLKIGTGLSTTTVVGAEGGDDVLLDPATYLVTEDNKAGYTKTSTVCGNGTATTTNGTVTVQAGKNYICTITNDDNAPTTGTVRVIKHVVNNNGGTAVAADWTMVLSASSTPNNFAGSEGGVDVAVAPGAYTVTETGGPAGYALTASADCSGTIAIGQTKTCTLTNDDIAPQLTLVKQVVNIFRGTASAIDWTLTALGAANVPTNLSGTTPVSSGASFAADTYTLGEVGPAGYNAGGWVCTKNSIEQATSSTIALSLGDVATCRITNSDKQPGTLKVIKQVINNEAEGYTGTAQASDFTISVAGGNPFPASFSGSTTGVDVVIDADAAFNVAETGGPTSNYGVTYSGDCSGTMTEGGNLTCTVTNNDNSPTTGGLTVIKVVTNDNGGTMNIASFPLKVTQGEQVTAVTSGQNTQFAGGEYVVSEVGNDDYTASFSGDCDSSGVVSVVNGMSKTCTITNNDKAPSLTLIKSVINNNGGTAEADEWTLMAVGEDATLEGVSGVTSNSAFMAGTYTLTETDGPTGYTGSIYSCVINGGEAVVGNEVTLAAGDVATCTITNDDQPGTIHVVKHVINDNGGTNTAGDFSFQVGEAPAVSFIEDDEDSLLGTKDVQVSAGTYTITEVSAPGYGISYEGCANIEVVNGGTATCIITNDDGKATLEVVKKTTGGDGVFTLNLTQGENVTPITITTVGGSGTSTIAINAGSYDLTEVVPAGWTFTGSYCEYGYESEGSEIQNGESIQVASGEEVGCTFYNRASGADVSVTKTVDDNTPDANQNVTYTITATNAGPAAAANTVVTDLLPAGLSFVSADGDYATSTGEWTIGTLEVGSTTVMQIVAKVIATAGQTVTNAASITMNDEGVSDHVGTNNAATSTLVVNTPAPVTPPSGGGGGNGPIAGSLGGGGNAIVPTGAVLGASTIGANCERYLTSFIARNNANDADQVKRLQFVLKNLEGMDVPENGIYDQATYNAVHAFQTKYGESVLAPWGLTRSTGYVYLTTRKMVNTVYCQYRVQFPLSSEEQAIIDAYRAAGAGQTQTSMPAPAAPKPAAKAPSAPAATSETGETTTIPASENQEQAGAAGVTQSGGGLWGSVKNFFGALFGGGDQ